MDKNKTISRRGFVKGLSVGAGTVALTGFASTEAEAASVSANVVENKGVLVDVTKCIGCGSCQEACKEVNSLPLETTEFTRDWINPPKETDKTWTIIKSYGTEKEDGLLDRRFVKKQCMHCIEAACVSACPAKALTKSADGAVVYNPDLCIGCRYCMIACPYMKVNFQWEKNLPQISKCTFCADRIAVGKCPGCVEACPTGTLKFGTRDEMLQEAKERVAKGDKYINHIFGEKEIGGSNWMYISDVPFEKLGFPVGFEEKPLPDLTWASLSKIPYLAPAIAVGLTGVYYYTGRKHKVSEEEKQQDRKGGEV